MSWDDILSSNDKKPTQKIELQTIDIQKDITKSFLNQVEQLSTTQEIKPVESQPSVKQVVEEPKLVTSVWDSVIESTPESSIPKQVEITKDFPKHTNVTQEILSSQKLVPSMTGDFDMSEAKTSAQLVVTVYGHKGHGKTRLTFSLPGTIACISFDKQSKPIKELEYNNDPRITVYDAIRYLDESDPQVFQESSEYTFKYVNKILKDITLNPVDWIILDGTDVMQQICEQVMRIRNNLGMSQGISNLNVWKERSLYLRQIHRQSVGACRRGLIYTTYVEEVLKDEDSYVKRPKWTEHQLRESAVVIRVFSTVEANNRRFYADVESSKTQLVKTGLHVDVTGKGFESLGLK